MFAFVVACGAKGFSADDPAPRARLASDAKR
jgi:hypothetical protein